VFYAVRAAPRGSGAEFPPIYTFGFLYVIAIVALAVFADYAGRDRSTDPRDHCWPRCSDTHDVVERVIWRPRDAIRPSCGMAPALLRGVHDRLQHLARIVGAVGVAQFLLDAAEHD
jgi:hypothetical protein